MSTVLIANTGAIVVDAARRFRSLGWTVIGLDGGSAPAIAAAVDRLVPLTDAGGERLTWSASEDRDSVLRAIRACSPDAVFTGFGSLSEDPQFAQQVQADGRTWLGADPQILTVTQNKPATLERARLLGVPVLPHVVPCDDTRAAHELLESTPAGVVVKDLDGHGGNIRTAVDADTLTALLCGPRPVMVEANVEGAICIGVHLDGTQEGASVLAITRSLLSVGGRKLLESVSPGEAHAPGLASMARAVSEDLGLRGIATVEFLRDRHGAATLLEVNARLPLSYHSVELVSGTDMLRAQLRAAGLGTCPPAELSSDGPVRHVLEQRAFASGDERTLLTDLAAAGGLLSDARSGETDTWLLQRCWSGQDEQDCLDQLRSSLEGGPNPGLTALGRIRTWLARQPEIPPSFLPFTDQESR